MNERITEDIGLQTRDSIYYFGGQFMVDSSGVANILADSYRSQSPN